MKRPATTCRREFLKTSLFGGLAAATAGRLASSATTDEAKRFTRANKDRIAELLETLASQDKARQLDDGRYVAV